MSPVNPDKIKTVKAYLIAEDRPCVKCGYNLLGLMSDGVCPECGRKIVIKQKDIPRYSDNLVTAPMGWLGLFATGSMFLFLSSLGVFLSLGVGAWLAYRGILIGPMIAGVFGMGWYLGVWLVTRARPVTKATVVDPVKEWALLRWSARVTQAFWFIAALLMAASVKGGSSAFGWAALGAFAVAGLGMIPLCVLVSNIAYWGSDSSLAEHLRVCAWMIGFAAALVVLHVLNMITHALLLGGFWGALVFGLLLFFAVAPFFYVIFCCFQLQGMARWAMFNHASADAKDERLRRKAEHAAMQGPAPLPADAEPVDFDSFKLGDSAVTDEHASDIARRPQGHVVKRRAPEEAPLDIERRRPRHMGDEA